MADPFQEAKALMAAKGPLAKKIFDQLLPELKAWAFVVTGMDDFDAVKRVRDLMAEVPVGADFEQTRQQVARELEAWLPGEAADKRATMLMRHHVYAATAAFNYRQLEEMKDVFTHRQYVSSQDSKVRASHRALDGVVLPAVHPFWKKHTPPWAHNCRCQVLGLLPEDVEEISEEEKDRDPSMRLVLDGLVLKKLEQDNILIRGYETHEQRVNPRHTPDPKPYVTATPKELGNGRGYEWEAGTVGMSLADVLDRYDPATQAEFLAWAAGQKTGNGDGETVLDWLKAWRGLP